MNRSPEGQLIQKLSRLGFKRDEAKVYIELTRGPGNHLQLSRSTGVNRTKIYRIVAALEKQGLVFRCADDRGTFWLANDPSGLEVQLIEQEEKIKKQRFLLPDITGMLEMLKGQSDESFFVQTYEGAAGYKQMCWHELQAQGDLLVFGNGTVEQESADALWADRHRQRQIEAGYRTVEITNYDYGTNGIEQFTAQRLLENGLYVHRRLSPDILTFDGQTVVYNDTVAIYHWKYTRKAGLEIKSRSYARMMRQVFNMYWQMASDSPAA